MIVPKTLRLIIIFLVINIRAYTQLGNERTSYANSLKVYSIDNKNIGKIIIIDGLHSYLFLKSCSQIQESTGNYVTEFNFCNPNHLAPLNILVILQYDHLVDSVSSFTDSLATGVRRTVAENNSGTSFMASRLAAGGVLTFRLKSRKKIYTSITGVEGQLH